MIFSLFVGVTLYQIYVELDKLDISSIFSRSPMLVVVFDVFPGSKSALFSLVEPWTYLLNIFFFNKV